VNFCLILQAPVGGNAKTSKSDAGGSAKEVRIELEVRNKKVR